MPGYARAAILASAVFCACDTARERSAQERSAAPPLSASDVELRTNADGRPIAAADAGLDSTAAVARLVEVQAIADTATAESVLALALLRAGLLKVQLYPADYFGGEAAKRPQDFFHDEIAGGWLYNGADFDTLLVRFPMSPLADDARYAKLFLIPGGECEGRVDCIIGYGLHRPIEFLRTDANSPHAPAVLATINRELRRALADVPDLRTATESYDPIAVRGQLASYDSVARRLPLRLRDSATALLDSIWARFADR